MNQNRWPYNSRQWRKLRQMLLASEPLCRYCKELGKATPAEIADHIIPVKERPDLAFDMDNLQGLCKRCHDSVKQREEKTGKRIGCDEKGVPVDAGHWWNK